MQKGTTHGGSRMTAKPSIPGPPEPDPPGRAAAGSGLRWAIALFLVGGLLVLLLGGPSPPA